MNTARTKRAKLQHPVQSWDGLHFLKTLDLLIEGIQVIDFDWRYVYVNEGLMAYQNTEKAEFLGYTLMEKNPGIEETELFKSLHRCMTIRIPQQLKAELLFPDQSTRWFDFRIKPVEEGIIVLSLDISEKKKRAAELTLANKELVFQNEEKEKRASELVIANNDLLKTNLELDRFVYSVSHDLRSPLTSILGLLSFIEEDSREPDTLLHAEMIRSSVVRLEVFIKNILSYSRNNRTPVEAVAIPLPETVQAVVNSLIGMKDAQGMHFEIKIEKSKLFYSDMQRFNTILENLISNAIKYRDSAKEYRFVKISGAANKEWLELQIEDNSIGMEDEHAEKIFDMFYRISGRVPGSGLGLYIVKEMVEILQGTITYTSQPRVGTTFHLKIKNLK